MKNTMSAKITITPIQDREDAKSIQSVYEGFDSMFHAEQFAVLVAAQTSANTGIAYYVSNVVIDSNNFVCNACPRFYTEGVTRLSEKVLESRFD